MNLKGESWEEFAERTRGQKEMNHILLILLNLVNILHESGERI
jgi:hypothetical protein